MKKIIYLLSISFSVFSVAFAQNEATELVNSTAIGANEFKQNDGDLNLELSFDPTSIFNASSPGSVFGLQNGFGIKMRKFRSSSSAFRLGVDITFVNFVNVTQQQDDATNTLELKDKFNSFGITLRPGIEKHFGGTKRLSPYIGGELILGWQTSTRKSENQNGTAIEEATDKNNSFTDGMRFGMGGIAGVDYYVAKKLYLGVELNYSIVYFSQATQKTTAFDGTVTEFKRGSQFTFAPGAFAVFRIGYLF